MAFPVFLVKVESSVETEEGMMDTRCDIVNILYSLATACKTQ